MEVCLLGPLLVTDDRSQPVAIRGQRPLAVLAALALHPHQPMTTAQLIRALWGDRPPQAARQSVHVFIHQLRKALGPGVIRTHGSSYLLQVLPEQIDVVRFGRLTEQARDAHTSGSLEVAWDGFGQALRLWRGVALADFDEPFVHAERVRLEQQRLAVVEEHLRVGLALGRHAMLAGELEALTSEHPLREGLWELLMLARYRSGRQAGALGAYRAARSRLVEHGLEPGEGLRRLERAILRQDPALDLPHRQPALGLAPPTAPAPAPATRPDATQPVTPPASTTLAVYEERKTVTVMAVGVSRVVEPSDPEDVRAEAIALAGRVAGVVGRYGGIAHTQVIGRLLVVFGAEQSHEDDPERAVRAALELRVDTEATSTPVRIGVATGEVVAALTKPGDQTPTLEATSLVSVVGDVVDAATQLEADAAPGSVVVGPRTYWATGRVITYRPAQPTTGRAGPGEATAWVALAPRARTGAYKFALGDPVATPLIERDQELGVLQDLLSRFLRTREAQLLTVASEPGLGKTRLVGELGRLVDQTQELVIWRAGRSVAYGSGSLSALAEIVKAHAGILDSDSLERAQDKLGQAVAHIIPDPDEADGVSDNLRVLLGLAPATAGSTTATPEAPAAEMTAGWVRFLAAAAANRPMVVVFEDLHWADEPLVEFVDALDEQAGPVPLLVVCTARLEFFDRRPRWGGGKPNAATLSLSPLSSAGTARLLDVLLGDREVPDDTRQAVLAAAGGNPLYVEEYARLRAEGHPGAASDTPPGLPETLQQLIAARLDTLPRADKRLLQDAAVIGEVSWVGALAAVSGYDRDQVHEGLRRLKRGDFLRRVRASSVAGESEYAFRHPLILEVAYRQLLRGERGRKHHRAAAWLEQQPEPPIEQLVHHYRQALELTRASGQPLGDLPERTRMLSRAGGDHAIRIGGFDAAVGHYQLALRLWPANDPARPDLLLRLGRAQFYASHTGREQLLEAREAFAATADTDQLAEIDTILGMLAGLRADGLAAAHMQLAREGQPDLTAQSALAHAARTSDALFRDDLHATIELTKAFLAQAAGRFPAEEGMAITARAAATTLLGATDAEPEHRRGLAMVASAGHPLIGFIRWGLGWYLWWGGLLDRAAVAVEETRLASKDDTVTLQWMDVLAAGLDYAAGRWGTATDAPEAAIAQPDAHGIILPWTYTLRGRLRLGCGDLDGAHSDAAAAVQATGNVIGRRQHQLATALHCRTLLAAGHPEDARAELDQLLADLQANPDGSYAAPEVGLVLTELGYPPDSLPAGLPPTAWHQAVGALAAGDPETAARHYIALGSPADAADAWLHAAKWHATAGRKPQAQSALRMALDLWEAAGASGRLLAAKELAASHDLDPS